MPTINVDLSDTPDEMKPIEPGIYELLIDDAEVQKSRSSENLNLVVSMSVVTDGDQKDAQIRDFIPFQTNFGKIKLKRLCKSAGVEIPSGSFDVDLLKGMIVRAVIKNRNYNDPQTGEVRLTANVSQYLFENEESGENEEENEK